MVRKRRTRPRFHRVRHIAGRARSRARRGMKGLGGKFGGVSFHSVGFRLAVAKVKDFVGFHLGDDGLDHPFEMIITGLIPQARAGYMVPAGATELIAELADRAIFGGGGSLAGGFNLFGGMGSAFAGGSSKSGSFAGD